MCVSRSHNKSTLIYIWLTLMTLAISYSYFISKEIFQTLTLWQVFPWKFSRTGNDRGTEFSTISRRQRRRLYAFTQPNHLLGNSFKTRWQFAVILPQLYVITRKKKLFFSISAILYFPIPHNALCLPPKFCINYCCGMLLGICRPPKSISQQ